MSDNIDIYIDSAPIDIVVSGAQGATNTSGGGDLTSGPVTSSNGVSAIADAALTIAMTSGLQSALNGKQATLTNYSTISSLTGYPSSFTPSSHTHPWSQITGEANHVPFNIAPTSVPTTEGTVSWNSDDHTLNITTDVSGVVLQVGQEQHVRVRNTTGSTISNGAAVYLSGASGQRPTVALADADNDTHVASTIGLATADISHNAFGFVTVGGLVRDVNTTGMTEGAPIYLSGTAGGLTQTAPTSNVVRIGFCIVAGNNGTILVHVEKMSVKSADVLDASLGGNGAADAGKLVKFGVDGNIRAVGGALHPAVSASAEGGDCIVGSSIDGVGVYGNSQNQHAGEFTSSAGTYHVKFGDSGNDKSAIERVRGWFVWFYSTYVGRLKTADITANRDWTLPDASGTIALTSQIPDISGKQDAITSATDLTFNSFNCLTGTIEDLHVVMALTLDNALTIANGGTGSTTAAGARSNLGAQATLVSGTNIKTVAGQSLLGSTNIPALLTDPTGITGAAALTNIVSLTQVQYDAIGSKSSTTLYIIT